MRILALLPVLFSGALPVAAQPTVSSAPTGVVVMAHGGDPEWNASVEAAVASLRTTQPTALALGMADPMTLQAALDSLTAQGVEKVAVVRMFLSGASFRHQTEYLLGLRDDPPAHPLLMNHGDGGGHGGHDQEPPTLEPLVHDVEIVMSDAGLMESWVSVDVMVDRARNLTLDPSAESVVLLAHGMGDEHENQHVLNEMGRSVEAIRTLGFRDVSALTLREDWEEARALAEEEIRRTLSAWSGRGDRVLVIPFRLSGFGPYAEVLEGFEYDAGQGLLPHELIGTWVERTAHELLNPWSPQG